MSQADQSFTTRRALVTGALAVTGAAALGGAAVAAETLQDRFNRQLADLSATIDAMKGDADHWLIAAGDLGPEQGGAFVQVDVITRGLVQEQRTIVKR